MRAACADVNLACDDEVSHRACHLPCLTVGKRTAKPVCLTMAPVSCQLEAEPTANIPSIRRNHTENAQFRVVYPDWVVVLSGPA
jgi:hypothetical protein